jgi:hypothetical protein
MGEDQPGVALICRTHKGKDYRNNLKKKFLSSSRG